MSYRGSAWMSTLWDLGLTLFQLAHAILVGYFVDAAGNGEALQKGVAIYLPCIHFAIVGYLLWSTYVRVGQKDSAKKNPETLLGIWSEVINVVLAFGVLFNCARVWALPESNDFHKNPFLHNLADSCYESSMVQFGVGYVAAAPTTLIERLVTFLTAYVGGLLFVNIFLINVIFSRRFWASLPEEKEKLIPSAPVPVQAAIENWRLSSIVAARA